MGYASLSADAKGVLQEVARMAYGSGFREGRNGGEGRMGLLKGPEGKVRVVKFNTHWTERWSGPSAGPAMWESSNRLRALLLQLGSSASLNQDEMNRIREQLKLPQGQDSVDKTLDRRDVAKVVTLIGGDEVWNDALAGHGDMSGYRSAEHASFADLTNQALANTTGVQNVKTVDETKSLNGIYAQFLGTVSQSVGRQLPSEFKRALCQGFIGQDAVLMSEGYLSSLTQQTVAEKMKRLVGELVQLAREENAPQPNEVVAYARTRMRPLLNVDKYVLATYGNETYQDVKLLEKFGVSPEALDLQVFQMAHKYGFSDDERKTIFQTAARYMAQQLRGQSPAGAQELAGEMTASLRGDVSVAVFTGMAACREENETRRNEIIQNVGQLENAHVRKLLEHFVDLSGVGGFDSDAKANWDAFVKYLSRLGDDLYNKVEQADYSVTRKAEVESYLADAAAVERLNAEIDAFCQTYGEEYRNVLKVPARSFEACVGQAKPSSYCEPYARYRFELVKRIVDSGLKVLHVNELTPQNITLDDIAKMVDGKFDDLTVVNRESVRKFMFKAGFEALKGMPFFEGGAYGMFGANFAEALDKKVSGYPQDKQNVIKEILLGVLERKLLAKGPILGPDGLQDALGTIFATGENESYPLLKFFASVPTDDLVVLRNSGIDLLEVVRNLPQNGNMTADGHLLSLLVKPQEGAAPASFAGHETDLVQKIVAFENYIRSDAMPRELRFAGDAQNVLAIVASAYPGLVDFVNQVSAGTLTQQDTENFVAFVKPKMEKLQDTLSQLARHMVGNEASQKVFKDQLKSLTAKVYINSDGLELLKVVGDDARLNGLLDELKEKYVRFASLQKDADQLLGEMRKLGVLDIDNLESLLGDEPKTAFTRNGLLRPLPKNYTYCEDNMARIVVRRAALEKYAKIRSENNGETPESKVRATAAELILRMLGCTNVAIFTNVDGLQAFYEALCTDLSRNGGIFDQIEGCLQDIGAAADDETKADVMVAFFRKMARHVLDVSLNKELPFYDAVFSENVRLLEGADKKAIKRAMLGSIMTADSRLSSAFDDLMRTNIGSFVDKLNEEFDPGPDLTNSEKGQVNELCNLHVDSKNEDLRLWTSYGLDANQGILNDYDVKRLTRCGLTPSVIEAQIAPTVTRFGLTEDEQKTVIQAISAILARKLFLRGSAGGDLKDVGENVLAKVKANVRQVLAGLADGTGGPLVAALLLCKSGKSQDEIKRTIVYIAGADALRNIRGALDRPLFELTNGKGAVLMAYFNQLSQVGQIPGDIKSKWEAFAKLVLADNAAELEEVGKDDYLKDRKAAVESYVKDDVNLRARNDEIARLCGTSEDLKKRLLVPERKTMADYFGEVRRGDIRALYAQCRARVIQALSKPIEYGPNHYRKQISLSLTDVCDILAGRLDMVMRFVDGDAQNAVRDAVGRVSREVLQDVIGGDMTVRDLMSRSLHIDPPKAETCQKILAQALIRSDGEAKFLGDDKSFAAAIDKLTSAQNNRNKTFAPIAAVMPADDLKIIADNDIDVIEVFGKVKGLLTDGKLANYAATGRLLGELLRNTTERDADRLAATIKRFYDGLSTWREGLPVQNKPDGQDLSLLTLIASAKVNVKDLTGNVPLGVEVFDRALADLKTVKRKVSETAERFAGKDADQNTKAEVRDKVFLFLLYNKNAEAILQAAQKGGTSWDELFKKYADRIDGFMTGLQGNIQRLVSELKGLGLLSQNENPVATSLYGVKLNELLREYRPLDSSMDKEARKVTAAVDARIKLLKACAEMKQKAGTDRNKDLSADFLLKLFGLIEVKLQVNVANLTKAQEMLAGKLPDLVQSFEVDLGKLTDPNADNDAKVAAFVALGMKLMNVGRGYWPTRGNLTDVLIKGVDEDSLPGIRSQTYFVLLQTVPGLYKAMEDVVKSGVITDEVIASSVQNMNAAGNIVGMQDTLLQQELLVVFKGLKSNSLSAS